MGARLAFSYPFVRGLWEQMRAGRGHAEDIDFLGVLGRVLDAQPDGVRSLTDARVRTWYRRWRRM